jgi:hypothetical protein
VTSTLKPQLFPKHVVRATASEDGRKATKLGAGVIAGDA